MTRFCRCLFGLIVVLLLFFVLEDDDDVVQVFVGGIIPQLTRDPPTADDIKCYEMLSELGITKFGPRLQMKKVSAQNHDNQSLHNRNVVGWFPFVATAYH